MLKRIVTVFLVLITLLSVLALPMSYAQSGGAEYAFHVKGGTVKSAGADGLNELLAAFTGEDGTPYAQKVEGKENAIELVENIVLDAPVRITNGSYRIYGRYLSIYRGFDGQEPMFLILGIGQNASSLVFEDSGTGEWSTPNLTLDGNSSEFPNASTGMIMLKGRASLTVNKGVLMTNSSTSAYGGAIYAELAEEGFERSPLAPQVELDNCMITNCYAQLGGGAIAMLAYYSGTDGGRLSITNSILKNNRSDSTEVNGLGGAVYSVGGDVKMEQVKLLENKAHNGGAIYSVSETEITGCMIQHNTALIAGGAVYCGTQDGIGGNVEIADSEVSYNSSEGVGGAFANKAGLTVSGFTLVTDNEAVGNGGGVYNEGGFALLGGSLMSNKSGGIGGGICSVGGNSGVNQESGEINNNNAALCSGVYCEGNFVMLGGAIGNNKGDAPHILIKGEVVMGGSAFVQNNTIGLCVSEKNGEKYYPSIELESKLTTGVVQEIGYYKEKLDSEGEVTGFKKATRSGVRLYFNSEAIIGGSDEIFKVKSRGLFSYKLDDGVTSVRFIFIPIWGWLLIALALIVATGFIFRHKLLVFLVFLKNKFKKKKNPVVYNGVNKRKSKRNKK